jgi:hypothetical protein
MPEKRLLCISDLEGCIYNEKIKASSVMCEKPTYEAIINYLGDETDFENHVVFLGDYFDQGPHMMKSINGIGSVIDAHYEKGRVHIILGNRDINKFRILYEAINPIKIQPKDDEVFGDWSGKFADDILNKGIVKKTSHLLINTYGAPNLLKNIITECGEIDLTISEAEAIYIICSIYEPNVDTYFKNKEKINPELIKAVDDSNELKETNKYKTIKDFIKNARKIFFYGKLISTFDLDTDYHVLMSHGGSYNKNIFNIPNLVYDKIFNFNDLEAKNTFYQFNNYFSDIETYRKKFAIDINDNNNNNNNDDILSVNPKEKNLNTLNNINNIYIDEFIKKIFKVSNKLVSIDNPFISLFNQNIRFRKAYFILQALGLNITNKELDKGKGFDRYKFVSPIASCGVIGGCRGIAKQDDEIINIFSDLKIKYVVNGHIPHCVTVPIIYQRKFGEDKRVVFVNCDTSNGNTPPKYKELNTIPLAYITKDKVGISSLNTTDSKLNSSNTKGYTNNNDDDTSIPFQDLIKEWNYAETPIAEGKSIKYGSNIYLNPDTSSDYAPMKFSETGLVGGRIRRKICSKKMMRKCKNKLTKKNRRSKNKHNRRCC